MKLLCAINRVAQGGKLLDSTTTGMALPFLLRSKTGFHHLYGRDEDIDLEFDLVDCGFTHGLGVSSCRDVVCVIIDAAYTVPSIILHL